MQSRGHHTRKLLADAHVLQAMGLATLACLATAGLLYAWYFRRVWRTARHASTTAAGDGSVLLFGKHAPRGEADADFQCRLDRAMALISAAPVREVLLLGGGPAGVPTEAQIAHAGLAARGLPTEVRVWLEHESRDTLENLRNARALLQARGGAGAVVLVSSRYHLARCLQFARQLGLDARACAAEATFQPSWTNLRRVAGEAAFVCLADVGTRWARLIGARKMLARVT